MKRYKIVLATALLLQTTGYAQVNELPNPQPSFIALIVSDIDSSLNWYISNLGFEQLNRVEFEDRGFKQANLKRGPFHIELIELNSAIHPAEVLKDKPRRTRLGGIFKFGFQVAQFDNWITHLNSVGVIKNQNVVTDPISEKRMIIVNDPDGNRIQIFDSGS